MEKPNEYTEWQPTQGQLILLPSRLPSTRGTLVLPESYTKKNNSGIVIKVGSTQDQPLIGLECHFPSHSEFQVIDSDTGYLLYIIPTTAVLMTRIPPHDVNRVSREKGRDYSDFLSTPTLTHDQR